MNLLSSDEEQVGLWTRAILSLSLIEFLLDELGLSNIDVPFRRSINHLLAHVPGLAKLNLWRSQVWLDVEVDQAPVLQECMQPNYTADISRQLFAALCSTKIRVWILAVKLDDEVPVVLKSLRILVSELLTKPLRKCLHLDLMDG